MLATIRRKNLHHEAGHVGAATDTVDFRLLAPHFALYRSTVVWGSKSET